MNSITQRFSTIHTFLGTQHMPSTSYWSGIFTWNYWSDQYLADFSNYMIFFMVIILLLIIGLVIWRVNLQRLNKVMPIYKPLLLNIPSIIILLLVSSIMYIFSRAIELPYFSSRFFMLGVIIVLICWLGFLGYYAYRVIPTKRHLHLEKERFLRYIPKKKARSN